MSQRGPASAERSTGSHLHAQQLHTEIERYLATIALFRELGYEPFWEREEGAPGRVIRRIAPYAHRPSSRMSSA